MEANGWKWVPAWTVGTMLVAHALGTGAVPMSWWMPLGFAPVAVIVAVVVSFAQDRPFAVPHRALAVAGACLWAAMVARSGWTDGRAVAIVGGALIVAALEYAIPGARPAPIGWVGQTAEAVDRRPTEVLSWETLLRQLTRKELHVREIRPWARPSDGQQIHVDLPVDMTVKDLAAICDKIAAGRRLPQGCVVEAKDGAHQGSAVLDVMLRDCLAGDSRVIAEPTSPASINDSFDVATTARGEELTVCLRQKSAVIGGTVGSGKTTLLHRIIFFLARCTDTLVWVVDFNGGGVAAPWIRPWAVGAASAPVVDWVADTPEEAAVMLAVGRAIAKDRKTSREAIRRKRAANTTVLPVDKDLPAFVILTDEGGEVRQAAGLLARLVDDGIARLAQIARAEGGRVVMSVLRGTGDLLGKGLRSVAGVRVCLRMEEEGEYDHVLGVNPGRARLLHIGSTYVYRTDTDYRPVLARTVDVDLDSIEQHAVATARLRPRLDERAQQVAAKVTVQDVLDGRDPRDNPDIARLPVMRDVENGRAYEGRWERKAAMLAELRGEDVPDDEPALLPAAVPDRPTVAAPGSAAERLLLGTGVVVEQPAPQPRRPEPEPAGQRDMLAEAEALLSPEHLALDGTPGESGSRPATAREAILLVLRDARPDLLTNAQVHARVVEAGYEVSPQRVHQLLTALTSKGEVRQVGTGYELP
ncbi:hypothetical protein ABZ793_12290 [Micromonospora sp. NPDC047465]|uniref:hypothetical protein n=1 Tax=Micromonospora sp. NPDC047465 TaxID=3154813 RepID=UPI0033E13246